MAPPWLCAGVAVPPVWSGYSPSCSLTEGRSFSPGWRVDSATGIGVLPISPTTPTAGVGGSRSPLPSLAIFGSWSQGWFLALLTKILPFRDMSGHTQFMILERRWLAVSAIHMEVLPFARYILPVISSTTYIFPLYNGNHSSICT